MCEYLMNGICFDPKKHQKGFVAQKCDHCPKQNMTEMPNAEIEYIHPVFR
jgi:hypothetical protein